MFVPGAHFMVYQNYRFMIAKIHVLIELLFNLIDKPFVTSFVAVLLLQASNERFEDNSSWTSLRRKR